MVIDIDSFLEKYTKDSEQDKKADEKEENNYELDFQKDVEDRLLRIRNKFSQNDDLHVLEKIYDEIKSFDEDLPQKFLGIGDRGRELLKDLGGRYSKEFLQKLKNNSSILQNNIEKNLKEIDLLMNTENFSKIVGLYDNSIKLFEMFPREFMDEKLSLGKELKRREIAINNRLNSYKDTKLKHIKHELKKSIKEVKASLRPLNIDEIEQKVNKLSSQINSIPKLFLTDLTEEKVFSLNILADAQDYLREQYLKDFENKENTLKKMFERFHNCYLKKDVEKALLIYDEMAIIFKELPEVFLERKIEIFKKLNETFTYMNDLVVKNSVSMFLDAYNNSKTIDEIKNYISHALLNPNTVDFENIEIIKSKLNSLPDSCELEKSALGKELIKIESVLDSKKEVPIKQNSDLMKEIKNKLRLLSISNDEIEFKEIGYELKELMKNSELSTKVKEKIKTTVNDIAEKKFGEKNKSISSGDTYIELENNVNKKLMEEVNFYFKKLKETADEEAKKIYYKKILFYMNIINLEKPKKDELINKLKNAMKIK